MSESAGSVYAAAGGRDGLLTLAAAWHARVLADPVVEHAFSHGFRPDHTERLAAYWAEALGGPADYGGTLGDETEVRRLHAGNGEHDEMDARAIDCFRLALTDVDLTGPIADTLLDYFTWATGTMADYPDSPDDVPDGLPIARWDWSGPVR